jgi:signal transduction histidine kinase
MLRFSFVGALTGAVFAFTVGAAPIQGVVSCDTGVGMPRVQALVKKTVAALKEHPDTVIAQINAGDPRWKDGPYYVFVARNTTLLAHGYLPQYVGQDLGSTTFANGFYWVKSAERVALENGGGCLQYRMFNPSKHGAVEYKVAYVMPVSGSMWAGSGTYVLRP